MRTKGIPNRNKASIIVSDNGCDTAKSAGYYGKCIDCPFETCFEDKVNIGPEIVKKKSRDEQVRKDIDAGMNADELMGKYGVSRRTIQRAFK